MALYALYVPRAAAVSPDTTAGAGPPDVDRLTARCAYGPAPRPRSCPEFPEGMQWLNTDKPLRLADLRGKVVLLDFWTYCCINCMHIIPELTALEKKYAELVVIGVHSAKFQNEGDVANIRQAILRYEIQHPVVNDRDFHIWRQCGAGLADADGGQARWLRPGPSLR